MWVKVGPGPDAKAVEDPAKKSIVGTGSPPELVQVYLIDVPNSTFPGPTDLVNVTLVGATIGNKS